MKEELRERWQRRYLRLQFINNCLLFPLFTMLVLELLEAGWMLGTPIYELSNYAICGSFFLEWLLGLILTANRRSYFLTPVHLMDLISSIPLGYWFQIARAVRMFRLVRLLRLAIRARRYTGTAVRLVRFMGVVTALAWSSAMALQAVEPEIVSGPFDAIWWAFVTITTVGYGDITPVTPTGRLVASLVMFLGIGVFGTVASFLSGALGAELEDESTERLERMEANQLTIIAALEELKGEPQ